GGGSRALDGRSARSDDARTTGLDRRQRDHDALATDRAARSLSREAETRRGALMSEDMSIERYRAVLASQPFSAHLGTTLEAAEPGRVQLALPITPQLLQQHGFVHGGAIAYLADNALTFAGGSLLGDSLTVEFKVNYVRPAVGPGRLLADATSVAHGRMQAVCRCDVYVVGEKGRKLCAVAQGTIRKVEPER